ncbi:MAG: (2Fe-2S)-binding protein [Nocardioidaceae bacterium]
MIICHCRVVSDAQVAAAVESGSRSLAAVCRSTGAGQDCGTCVFSVRRLVCEHTSASAPVLVGAGVDEAAS